MKKIFVTLLMFLALLGLASCGNTQFNNNKDLNNNIEVSDKTEKVVKNKTTDIDTVKDKVVITVIDDKRCTDCKTDLMVNELSGRESLKDATFNIIDFNTEEAKKILDTESFDNKLPFVIFPVNELEDNQLKKYLYPTKSGNKFFLNINAQFDPYGEICGNNIDDNNDGKTDCEDLETCGDEPVCFEKQERPVADLYIMSYCPYGLQSQKGFLSSMQLLKDKADLNIKFVHYLMHGKKEGEENVRQYCIQKEDKDQYINYLSCFLDSDDSNGCIEKSKIDNTKLDACIKEVKEKYNVDELMNSGERFPEFRINKTEALKNNVSGSPTFILNGHKIDGMGRSPNDFLKTICDTFKEKPEVCNQEISKVPFDPNFGFTAKGKSADGGCGL